MAYFAYSTQYTFMRYSAAASSALLTNLSVRVICHHGRIIGEVRTGTGISIRIGTSVGTPITVRFPKTKARLIDAGRIRTRMPWLYVLKFTTNIYP